MCLSCSFSVLVPVKGVNSVSLSFLVSRPRAKWDIMVTQEQCKDEEDHDDNTEDMVEEVTTEAIATDIQGMTCNSKTCWNHNWPRGVKP